MNNKSGSDGLHDGRSSSFLLALDVLQVEVLVLGHEEDGAAARMNRSVVRIEELLLGHQDSGRLRPPNELVARKVDRVLFAKPVDVVTDL